MFAKISSLNTSISKPKVSDRNKVVHAIIKSSGAVVNVRTLAKNIRNMTTEMVKGKLPLPH